MSIVKPLYGLSLMATFPPAMIYTQSLGGWWFVLPSIIWPALLGNPGTVTRDQLGHLGGDPHFHPPAYDPVNDILHGIAPRTAQPDD